MFDIQKIYRAVHLKDISDEELKEYLRITKECGIESNDALLAVLFIIQKPIDILNAAPKLIDEGVKLAIDSAALSFSKNAEVLQKRIYFELIENLKRAKDISEATARISVDAAMFHLSEAVDKTARGIAEKTTAIQNKKWVFGVVAVSLLALLGVGGAGVAIGRQIGYSETADQKAADGWGNSPQGQLAHRLAGGGDLEALANCSGLGWENVKGICRANAIRSGPDKGRMTGWALSK